MDAWVTRWDNVGFDGPVIANWREYEVADSLTPGTNAWNRSNPVISVGYRVSDAATGPTQTLRLRNVDTTNAVSARLWVSAWYLTSAAFGADPTKFVLRYGQRQGMLMVPARLAQASSPWLFGLCLDQWGAGALWLSGWIGLLAFGALLAVPTSPGTTPPAADSFVQPTSS
jgi:hypothetical protein